MINPFNDEYFMRQALEEAKKAFSSNEVPVGAVIVVNEKIIAKAHNLTERLNDITAHAEIQAITSACEYLGSKYLNECTLYVTLEPCSMCAGAIFWSKMKRVVYGSTDKLKGASSYSPRLYHPKTIVENGVLENETTAILKEFFLLKRN